MPMNDDQAERLFERGSRATGAVTVQADAMACYETWRNFEQLNHILGGLVSIKVDNERVSTWTVVGPAGREFTWTAELIRDEPGKIVAWRTVGEADIPSAGAVRFRELENGRGTEVKATLEYLPPGGKVGDAVGKQLGQDAQTRVRAGLFRFRQLMETGELTVSRGETGAHMTPRQQRERGSGQKPHETPAEQPVGQENP